MDVKNGMGLTGLKELMDLGDELLQAGRIQEAETAYRRATEVDKKYPRAWFNLAGVLSAQGQFDEALKAYKTCLKLDKKDADCWGAYATILKHMRNYKEAEKAFKEAEKYDPETPMVWFNFANLLREQGRHKQAVEKYQFAISMDPNNPNYWNNLGFTYEALDDYKSAERAFERTIELDSSMAGAWRELGALRANRGELDSALEAMNRCTELDPDDIINWENRGKLALDIDKSQEAFESYEKVVELDPTHLEGWIILGAFHYARGNLTDARRSVEQALKINPKDARAMKVLDDINDVSSRAGHGFSMIGGDNRMFINDSEGNPTRFYFVSDEDTTEGTRKLPKPAVTSGASKTYPPGYWDDIYKGLDLIEAGQYAEAEEVLIRKAEKEKDDNYNIVCYLADSLLLQNKLDDAEELYRACIELNPLLYHPHHGLYLILKRRGLETEAQQCMEYANKTAALLGKDKPKHLPDE